MAYAVSAGKPHATHFWFLFGFENGYFRKLCHFIVLLPLNTLIERKDIQTSPRCCKIRKKCNAFATCMSLRIYNSEEVTQGLFASFLPIHNSFVYIKKKNKLYSNSAANLHLLYSSRHSIIQCAFSIFL